MNDAARCEQARTAYEKFGKLWTTKGAIQYIAGTRTRIYEVSIPEGMEITPEEILWVLDRGNGSFGGAHSGNIYHLYVD